MVHANTSCTCCVCSGLNVINPPTDAGVVDRILKKAAEGGAEDSGSAPAHAPIRLTFFKSGFVIDDGELRRYDDKANAAFMKALEKG